MKIDVWDRRGTSGSVTSVDLFYEANKVLMNGNDDIIMSPSIAVLLEGNTTVTQDVSSGGVVPVAKETPTFRFYPPTTKVGRAGKRLGNTVKPKR